MARTESTGSLVFAALVGVAALLFACGAGYWYVAHHMAWWTFALTYTGLTLGTAFIKEIAKEARK